MEAWRVVDELLVAQKLAWKDVWRATVDVKEMEVIVVAMDGRKWKQAIKPKRPRRVRVIKK